MIEVPYGSIPYLVDLGDRPAKVVIPAVLTPPPPLNRLLDEALARPIGRPPVESMVRAGARVTVVVSDATRKEPRRAFLAALRARLPAVRWTLAIATGTHGPTQVEALDLLDPFMGHPTIVNHDGHCADDLVELGVTNRGTPVRLHRCVVEADLVVATGCIRPHYFAGFGAGVKAIFPGLGAASAIRANHRLKTEPGARTGHVDDNPCRLDLEEAVRMVPSPTFLLNGVCGPDDEIHAVVAGDLEAAFRVGAELARPWFTVRAPVSSFVIASDALPITASLYQAAKIAAAAAPLVEAGGTLVLVAECAEGCEPLATVNEAIFRIGVFPRLAPGARIHLVSSLTAEAVDRSLVEYAPSVECLLERARGTIVVVPRASQLIVQPC